MSSIFFKVFLIFKGGKIRMQLTERNFKFGLTTIIIGYFTFIFHVLTIYANIEFMKINANTAAYIFVGVLGFLILASGIIFLISLIFNIKETKVIHKISKGLMLTLISIPPILLCYLAITVKALTEGH
jgi:nitrate reductase gamma subunit